MRGIEPPSSAPTANGEVVAKLEILASSLGPEEGAELPEGETES